MDNNIKFPHYIDKNLMFRGGVDPVEWVNRLFIQDTDRLPGVLQHHPAHDTSDMFDQYIKSTHI